MPKPALKVRFFAHLFTFVFQFRELTWIINHADMPKPALKVRFFAHFFTFFFQFRELTWQKD